MNVLLARKADVRAGQGIALCHEDLRAHQINARDPLGNGVFDLDAGVHLDEIILAALIHEELQRAGVYVFDVFGDFHGVRADLFAQLLGHRPCRREFHDLLVAPLQGAVALAKMVAVAVFIRKHLHFDVLWLNKEFFDEDIAAAEGFFRLGTNQLKCGDDLLLAVAAAHTASAAAGCGLENDGEAVFLGFFKRLLPVLQRLCGAGDDGHAAGNGHLLGGELVAHFVQNVGGRADELDAVGFAGAGKLGVFRQEAVAGVDGVHAAALGQIDDGGNVQIHAERRVVFADEIGLVRTGAEQAHGVFLGVDGHGMQAEVIAGAENAYSDLAAVGDEYLGKCSFIHAVASFSQINYMLRIQPNASKIICLTAIHDNGILIADNRWAFQAIPQKGVLIFGGNQ